MQPGDLVRVRHVKNLGIIAGFAANDRYLVWLPEQGVTLTCKGNSLRPVTNLTIQTFLRRLAIG